MHAEVSEMKTLSVCYGSVGCNVTMTNYAYAALEFSNAPLTYLALVKQLI